jgi:hypothetical protein
MLYGTSLELALRNAGVKPVAEDVGERMRQLAVLAWSTYGHDRDYREREAFMETALQGEGSFWVLETWPQNENYLQKALAWLLKTTRAEMEREKQKGAGQPAPAAGPVQSRDPAGFRPAATPSPDEDRGATGHAKPILAPPPDPLAQSTTSSSKPEHPTSAAPPPHMKTLLEATTAGFYLFNPFEEVLVNGRPLGRCQFGEAISWFQQQVVSVEAGIVRQQRHLRVTRAHLLFVQRLKANRLNDDVIQYWYRDLDEVRRMYAQAFEECEATV